MENIYFGENEQLLRLILKSAKGELLKKAVFSKSQDKSVIKCVLTPKLLRGELVLYAESFHSDNKAKQKNIPISDESEIMALIEGFAQINLITTAGDCELKRAKSGKVTLIGGDKLERALDGDSTSFKRVVISSNNKVKNHILSGNEPFLVHLGVSDKNGRVYDKKQAKFRQINRFLELIRDVEDKLPTGDIRICDLCCGKSYLSFAVYHYFAIIKGRHVKMTGVDLKADVIEYCNKVASACGFDGLEFLCGDINLYDAEEHVNLVISLHACDIATDMVLDKAIAWDADVVLSTPCCHHDLNKKINSESLKFITDHSMLRQKLCDAATDALRLKKLEWHGYDVMSLELIDPDETPKNIMLRGVRRKNFDMRGERAMKARAEYIAAYEFLTGKKPQILED